MWQVRGIEFTCWVEAVQYAQEEAKLAVGTASHLYTRREGRWELVGWCVCRRNGAVYWEMAQLVLFGAQVLKVA